jgi:hypothetical protein
MNSKETNELLLLELAKFSETGDLSDVLKSLFYQICKKTIDSDRYKFLDDDLKFTCVLNAYKACLKQKFNPQRSNDAYMYIKTIVRSSISSTIVKMKKNL